MIKTNGIEKLTTFRTHNIFNETIFQKTTGKTRETE